MTTTLSVTRRDIQTAGIRRVAFFVTDEAGREISQPYPSRSVAMREAAIMADEFSDITLNH